MDKKKYIYIWEYGMGMGHLCAFLSSAVLLAQKGWQGIFYIPAKATNIESCKALLKSAGIPFEYTPGSQIRRRHNTEIKSHLDIVNNLDCFESLQTTQFIIKSWLTIFNHHQPDIAIGDFALLPLYVARSLNITTVALDTGYFYPDHQALTSAFTSEIDNISVEQLTHSEKIFTNQFNETVSKLLPKSSLKCFLDIYNSDKTLLLNFEELAAFKHKDKSDFLGSVLDSFDAANFKLPSWKHPSALRPKIFCYLYIHTEQALSILKTMYAKKELDVLVYAPSAPKAIIETFSSDHMQISDVPLKISAVLKNCHLVISHGGSGLTSQSLWNGVPMIVAPLHYEQKMNGDRIVEGAYGVSLYDSNYEINSLSTIIDNVLENPIYTSNARSFKYKNTLFNANQIVAILEELYDQSQLNKTANRKHKISYKSIENNKFKIASLETVFLSYDEPNADKNWYHLKTICPNAVRVHGIKGLDSAHKAAMEAVNGDRFIIVDGDNWVDEKFFSIRCAVPLSIQHSVWQWCSTNSINSLAYAAGGIKIWTREILSGLRSHENTENESRLSLDFWDNPAYCVFKNSYSTTVINYSPLQAFRAGFREGVKYAIGNKPTTVSESGAEQSLSRRIAIWMSLGIDKPNGYWGILGARHGYIYGSENSGDRNMVINDYNWIESYWRNALEELEINETYTTTKEGYSILREYSKNVETHLTETRAYMVEHFSGYPVLNMDKNESLNFRQELLKLQGNQTDFFEILIDGG